MTEFFAGCVRLFGSIFSVACNTAFFRFFAGVLAVECCYGLFLLFTRGLKKV